MAADCQNLDKLFQEASNYEKLGNKDMAYKLYNQFISCAQTCEDGSLKEKLALAFNNRGFLRYLKVDFDEAIEDYSEGLKYNPGLAVAFHNRGLIHYRLGRFSQAITDMEQCLKLHPSFEPAEQCLKQARIDKQNKENDDR